MFSSWRAAWATEHTKWKAPFVAIMQDVLCFDITAPKESVLQHEF